MSSAGEGTSSQILADNTKSQNEEFFRAAQVSIETGYGDAFKNLNTALYNTINNAFATFQSDNEKKLEENRQNHENAVQALTDNLETLKKNLNDLDLAKTNQQEDIVNRFQEIQNLKMKTKIFTRIKKYATYKKRKAERADTIANYLDFKRRYLVFNSWRNLTNSLSKGRIKLKCEEEYANQYNQMSEGFSKDMTELKDILRQLEEDIQKEIEERKNLSELYDLSMKKGAVEFLKETNYIVGFNSSQVGTPNERSLNEEAENQI
ncbi:MAG: hypothetical protein MJ252_18945 [archaeon]|nr:hypothetical protein [archaeon]